MTARWLLQLHRDLRDPFRHAFIPSPDRPDRCHSCDRADELHPEWLEGDPGAVLAARRAVFEESAALLERRLREFVEDG